MLQESDLCEIWRPVTGWVGLYEVSDAGHIRSLTRILITKHGNKRLLTGRILKPRINKKSGHHYVTLGQHTQQCIHILVLEAFEGSCPKGKESRHLDGDPAHNMYFNLCYGTRSENILDRVRHGTHHQAKKLECKYSHRLCAPNLAKHNSPTPKRDCLACNKTRSRCRYLRTKGYPVPDFRTLADQYYTDIMRGWSP